MGKAIGKIVVEIEGLSPSKEQMEAIGNAVQAAVVQCLPPNENNGLLIRPSKLDRGGSELTLRLAKVVAGGSM